MIEEFGRQTGGVMMTVLSEEDMSAAVSLVESRLRGQYLIGFRPAAGPAGGGFRRVGLTIPERRLKVVTREGYYPGGSSGN